jgi:hypothetical protein
MRRRNWWFNFGTVSTVYIVQIVAVLGQVFVVGGIERQTVAAFLQLGHTVVTLPVFVAGQIVWIEAVIVGAFETLLRHGCKREERKQKPKSNKRVETQISFATGCARRNNKQKGQRLQSNPSSESQLAIMKCLFACLCDAFRVISLCESYPLNIHFVM